MVADPVTDLPPGVGGRVLLGITGSPGAGKSTLAAALGTAYDAAVVPMDGFHLADVELVRRGLRDRKGAPETFDAEGYADLLTRLRSRPAHTVMAPMFERGLEQPVAGAIPVPASAGLVVTEGNYLLLERPPWPDVRAQLDRVWHVVTDDALRLPRLVARHVASGKSPAAAAAWVHRVDQANAVLVEEAAARADVVLDLTGWVSISPDIRGS
ncbi:nucleoside/nucleotide kinase family protein [Nocardioides sp. KIGAM211]|uniref:Nucleoside/nucleotide kinase family protein n=1 Tax=Nocardioides luti TaxID=2761101 RepID=A0A7X0RF55_9ACTN|nr:nucleoside/nucleotide kinase family protein [Nocardioides luti]